MIILCYITVWHKRTVSSFIAFTLLNGFCIATTVSTVWCSSPDPPRLEGPLKVNNHLLLAERLYEGQVLAPESIVFDHGGSDIHAFDHYCLSTLLSLDHSG